MVRILYWKIYWSILVVNLMARAWNSTTVSHTANKQGAAKWTGNLLDPL
jgi:hypothetical protein